MSRYAISDIHGCIKTFKALLKKLNFSASDTLFLLGDYVDRGPDSRGVINHILTLQKDGFDVRCLRGNHDQMMIDALTTNMEAQSRWLRAGGDTTWDSYYKKAPKAIPQAHLTFLQQLPYYLETESYILVHAGLNFKAFDPLFDKESMLWIRSWYSRINTFWLNGRIIVHGHTPISKSIIQARFKHIETCPAIDIDAGCVYRKKGMHHLCAFNLDKQTFTFQENIDN
ncbi:MAG: metallophosphoesterase family protein [Bacteroidota bacterium]